MADQEEYFFYLKDWKFCRLNLLHTNVQEVFIFLCLLKPLSVIQKKNKNHAVSITAGKFAIHT